MIDVFYTTTSGVTVFRGLWRLVYVKNVSFSKRNIRSNGFSRFVAFPDTIRLDSHTRPEYEGVHPTHHRERSAE